MALDLPTPRSHASDDAAHGTGPPDLAIIAQFKEQLMKGEARSRACQLQRVRRHRSRVQPWLEPGHDQK
eukprot:7950685-Karenia_brevis.AAC.1